MQLEQTIPYETKEGNKYLIQFSAFPLNSIPITVDLPVINLSLVQVEFVRINGRSFLRYLAQYVCDYINSHDVILYYYCDNAEIYRRKSRNCTPQEYRHKLFERLYNTIQNEVIIRENIFIKDEVNGNHYITLITNENNRIQLENLSAEFEFFKEK